MSAPTRRPTFEENAAWERGYSLGFKDGGGGGGGGPPGGDDPNRRYNDGLGVGISSTFMTTMLLLVIINVIYSLYLNPAARAALWGRLMNPFGRGGGPPGGGAGGGNNDSVVIPMSQPEIQDTTGRTGGTGGKRRTHRKRRNLRKSHRRRQRGGGGNVEADVETIFKIANEILKEYNNSSNIIDPAVISKITKKIVDSKYKSVIDEINARY
jgi:hypothetical protein